MFPVDGDPLGPNIVAGLVMGGATALGVDYVTGADRHLVLAMHIVNVGLPIIRGLLALQSQDTMQFVSALGQFGVALLPYATAVRSTTRPR